MEKISLVLRLVLPREIKLMIVKHLRNLWFLDYQRQKMMDRLDFLTYDYNREYTSLFRNRQHLHDMIDTINHDLTVLEEEYDAAMSQLVDEYADDLDPVFK